MNDLSELGRNLFGSLLAEFIVIMIAVLVRDDKKKVARVLALGTLVAGVVGFGPGLVDSLNAPSRLILTPIATSKPGDAVASVPTPTAAPTRRPEPTTVRGIALPAGQLIVFVRHVVVEEGFLLSPTIYAGDLFAVNPVGRSESVIISNRNYNETFPNWSADGSKLVYTKQLLGANDEIYVLDLDLNQQYQITNNSARDTMPSWSPDGGSIVFASSRNGGGLQIYTIRSDGTGKAEQLSNLSGDCMNPDWSPDGRHIVFAGRDTDSDYELFIFNIDTGLTTQLTDNSIDDVTPEWSPDGSRIAFASNVPRQRISNYEIYTMDLAGEVVRLTEDPANDSFPAWSPDGQFIAYATERSDYDRDILIMRSDGSEVTTLVATELNESYPAWRPR